MENTDEDERVGGRDERYTNNDRGATGSSKRSHRRLRPWNQRLLIAPELAPAHYQYDEIKDNVLKELRHLIFHLAKPMQEKKIFSQTLKLAKEIDSEAKLYDLERPCWTSTVDIIVSDTKFATRVGAHVVKTQPGTYTGCDRGVARCLHRAVSMGLHTRAAVPHGLRTPFGTMVRGKLRSEEYIAALIDLEVKLWHPKSFPESEGFHIEAPPYCDKPTICLHVPWHQKDVMLRCDTRASVPIQYRMVTNDDLVGIKIKEENSDVESLGGDITREDTPVKLENIDEDNSDEDRRGDKQMGNDRPPRIPVTDKSGFQYNESQADILSMNKWLNRAPRHPRPHRRFVCSHLDGLGGVGTLKGRPVVRREGLDSFITVRKMRDLEWGPDARDPRVRSLKRTQKIGGPRSKNALEPNGGWNKFKGTYS